MLLQIVSDLHLEFYKDKGEKLLGELLAQKPDGVDCLMLAGDFTCFATEAWKTVLHQFSTICEAYPQVYYVPGNHEYYRSHHEVIQNLYLNPLEELLPNLTILTPGWMCQHQGHTILGATLWFPYRMGDEKYYPLVNDFSLIGGGDFPGFADRHYKSCVEWFNAEITDASIVMTHHLPSYKSVDPMYAGSTTNRFFVGNVEDILLERKPAIWIHGHSHTSMDYMLGSTRVISNPKGYGAENLHFNPKLTIEL